MKRGLKKYENLTITDDFMFGKVMCCSAEGEISITLKIFAGKRSHPDRHVKRGTKINYEIKKT